METSVSEISSSEAEYDDDGDGVVGDGYSDSDSVDEALINEEEQEAVEKWLATEYGASDSDDSDCDTDHDSDRESDCDCDKAGW